MNIGDFSVTPSAIANGVDINTVSATIYDNQGDFAGGVMVIFEVNKDAIFETGAKTLRVESDVLGNVRADFVDSVAQTVTISAMLENNPSSIHSRTTEFTQGSGQVDTINLLLTIDESEADGEAQNEVILQTVNGANPVPDTEVAVSLTHGAVFINGESSTKIRTSRDTGTASLLFTNTVPGEVTLTAYLPDNIAIYSKVVTEFLLASTDIVLSIEATADNAVANGQSTNTVQVLAKNAITQSPVPGITITFSASGSAQFVDGKISGITDANGHVFASLVDTIVEDIQVSAFSEAGDQTDTVTLHFKKVESPIKITRIFNLNKRFPDIGPSVAWNGATFYIEAAGGSGNYSWSVTKGSEFLLVTDSFDNNATLRFSSQNSSLAQREFVVTLSDGVNKLNFSFTINRFFTEFGQWEVHKHSDRYPSVEQLTRLFNEWGDMRKYDDWCINSWVHYWSNESKFFQSYAVNVVNGKVDKIGHLYKCGYAGS